MVSVLFAFRCCIYCVKKTILLGKWYIRMHTLWTRWHKYDNTFVEKRLCNQKYIIKIGGESVQLPMQPVNRQ